MNTTTYDALRALITHWQAYEETTTEPDLKAFTVWLHHRLDQPVEPNRPVSTYTLSDDADYQNFSLERKISILIGRLGRIAKHYARRALTDLPITSLEEFTILVAIDSTHQPFKSELINQHYLELTTGSEVIRRLVRMGLLTEVSDQTDKRLKRLQLTQTGEQVKQLAIERMDMTNQLMAGNLTQAQRETLVEHLTRLDALHTDIYQRDTVSPLSALIHQFILRPEG